METWLLPLHSIGADYANLEGINAISNNIHRSTKNWLVSGSTDPSIMHRHTLSGGVITSVASLYLVKIPSILAHTSTKYHILEMFTSPTSRRANGKQRIGSWQGLGSR